MHKGRRKFKVEEKLRGSQFPVSILHTHLFNSVKPYLCALFCFTLSPHHFSSSSIRVELHPNL